MLTTTTPTFSRYQSRKATTLGSLLSSKKNKEIKIFKPNTYANLFFELLNKTPLIITDFEPNTSNYPTNTIHGLAKQTKTPYLLVNILNKMDIDYTWNDYTFPKYIFKFIYWKAKHILKKSVRLSKRNVIPLETIIESYNPKYNPNMQKLWTVKPLDSVNKLINMREVEERCKNERNCITNVKESDIKNIIVKIPPNWKAKQRIHNKLIYQGRFCRVYLDEEQDSNLYNNYLSNKSQKQKTWLRSTKDIVYHYSFKNKSSMKPIPKRDASETRSTTNNTNCEYLPLRTMNSLPYSWQNTNEKTKITSPLRLIKSPCKCVMTSYNSTTDSSNNKSASLWKIKTNFSQQTIKDPLSNNNPPMQEEKFSRCETQWNYKWGSSSKYVNFSKTPLKLTKEPNVKFLLKIGNLNLNHKDKNIRKFKSHERKTHLNTKSKDHSNDFSNTETRKLHWSKADFFYCS